MRVSGLTLRIPYIQGEREVIPEEADYGNRPNGVA